MKRVLSVIAMIALICPSLLARQWTSRSGGFNVEAELMDVRDGNAVLKKTDGTELAVPLNKLSLGDLRYIDETLNAAEARITGKGQEEAAAKPPAVAVPEPADKGPVAAAAGKLRYAWKQGQSYVYDVKITVDQGDHMERVEGHVTYKAIAVDDDGTELTVTGFLSSSGPREPERMAFEPAPHRPWFESMSTYLGSSVTTDSRGRVLRTDGRLQLPFLLGELSQLILEPLPDSPKSSWTNAGDTGVSVTATHFPFHRIYPFAQAEDREGTDANEKTIYKIENANDALVTVAKHYELATTSKVSGKPRIEALGDGKWKFDVRRGVSASLDFTMRVTVREDNTTEEHPVHVTYRLISEEEMARAAKIAEEAKKERERPLNAKDIADALTDLKSADFGRVSRSLRLLGQKSPSEPNPEIAKALEAVMLTGKSFFRRQAADALTAWSVPDNVPGLIQALADERSHARDVVIEILIKYKPESAIIPVSQCLADVVARNTASQFLKAMGPAAEDAVLAHAETHDSQVLREVLEILTVIGTKKSLPLLEKLAKDGDLSLKTSAQEALSAIKVRQKLQPAAK